MRASKKRTVRVFFTISCGIVVSLVATHFIHSNSQQVILCIKTTQECSIHKESELKAQYSNPNPNCIVTPQGKNICRPDFVLYRIDDISPALKQKCETKVHGHMTFWDTCVTITKIYKFDPLGPGWKLQTD